MSVNDALTNGGDKPAKANVPAIPMGNRGVELTCYEDAFRFAQSVQQSGLAPAGLQTPQAILVAIQLGAEIGLPPMASLQNIAVINGRPSIWGDAMLGVCRASGLFDEEAFDEVIEMASDGQDGIASCTVRRKPGKLVRRTFSIADAKKAGLWGKQGPWQQYPRRMLQMRARSWALRDAFSDVLRGMRATEELQGLGPTIDAESQPTSLQQLTEKLEAKPSAEPKKPPIESEPEPAQTVIKPGKEEVAAFYDRIKQEAGNPPGLSKVKRDIDKAVKAGKLTEQEANELKAMAGAKMPQED